MLLDEAMRDTVRDVLATHADRIDSAAVFGSRATGRARVNSDLDLVLYGSLSQADVDALWTQFEESALPVTVDVIAYTSDMYAPLREHIDRFAQPLFERGDLQAAA